MSIYVCVCVCVCVCVFVVLLGSGPHMAQSVCELWSRGTAISQSDWRDKPARYGTATRHRHCHRHRHSINETDGRTADEVYDRADSLRAPREPSGSFRRSAQSVLAGSLLCQGLCVGDRGSARGGGV